MCFDVFYDCIKEIIGILFISNNSLINTLIYMMK